MSDGGLKNDLKDSYELLKEMEQLLDELNDEAEMMDDEIQSWIDYNINDASSTLSPRNNYTKIQIGDVSEDVRRNAVTNVRNFTRDMDFEDVKNVLLDYDGNVDIGEILHNCDLDNLIVKNVDIFSWYNVLPDCTIGTIRFENCELEKHYSIQTLSDDVETSLDFIFENTAAIGKIECVDCSDEFVDVLMMGIDKVDENHRFGNIEIEIK